MRRPLRPEELRLWSVVASTVRAAPGKAVPDLQPAQAPRPDSDAPLIHVAPAPAPKVPKHPVARAPEHIEPGRKRRIVRERDPIEARLDLHGMDFDRARGALHAFIARSADEGLRAVLIITGKGVRGDGLLRRFTPVWLSEPPSRARVAGFSFAHPRHGGEGALYVALKRKG